MISRDFDATNPSAAKPDVPLAPDPPKRTWVRRVAFLAGLALLVAVSCKSRDDREEIRNRLGPPDKKVVRGADPFWSEIWYYYDEGVAYEFRRTAPRCGGGRDYYLYAEYIIGAKGLVRKPGTTTIPGEGSGTILGP